MSRLAISSLPIAISRTAALAALLLASGCNNHSDGTEPEKLHPRQESLELQAPGCDKNEDCASVSVTYQLFENQPALNNAIRRQLIQQLQGFDENAGAADSIADAATDFLEEAGQAPGDSSNRWHLQGGSKLVGRRGELVTIEFNSYAYTGGAHGMPATHWLNWDLEAGKPVALEQIIQPGQEAAFWELAREAHQRWLDGQADIDKEFRKSWPFDKTGDFRLDKKGLALLYGVYTLGPYAMGQVELTIPREALNGVIREEYLAE